MRLALNFQRVDPDKGGAETYVADLCRGLVAAGHDVHLYANDWRAEALPAELHYHRVDVSGSSRSGRIWSFATNSEIALRAAAPFDCTVGFINTWYHDVLIPQGGVHAASREANAKRFPPGWRRALYLFLKQTSLRSGVYATIESRQYDPAGNARVVAVSEMVRGHLQRFHHVPGDRIRVIPNAINAERVAVPDPVVMRANVRARLGLNCTDLVALFVGHNFRLKGLSPLLEALSSRKRARPSARPIHLLVCGGGRITPFRKVVQRLGLGDAVRLIGFMPDVREGFHAADFFVLPTYYDPCSLVVFEALACGLPVITTACNGAGELITEGREGFVISEPDALGELTTALERMADDRARREMSEFARILGRAQSLDNHVARLVALFAEVAESKRGAWRHGRPSISGARAC